MMQQYEKYRHLRFFSVVRALRLDLERRNIPRECKWSEKRPRDVDNRKMLKKTLRTLTLQPEMGGYTSHPAIPQVRSRLINLSLHKIDAL